MVPNLARPKTAHEIERKFLIKQVPPDLEDHPHKTIDQGYLAANSDGVQVRLRRAGDQFFLTYKRGTGLTREEREVELTRTQFDQLWPGTEGHRLTKTRYDVPLGKHIAEIDVYHGKNSGLMVAEVEFDDEEQCKKFEPPDWFGKEVSGEARYSNVKLARE
jgi:CYTH domain-containing protein